ALLADPTRSSAGYDVFLDASEHDAAIANELAQRLEGDGLRVLSNCQIVPGEDWKQTSERALDYSEVLLVAFGAETTSAARLNLIQRARSRGGIRIVPVLLARQSWTAPALRSFGLDASAAVDL